MLNHSIWVKRQLVDDPLLWLVDHLFNIGRRGKRLLYQRISYIEYVLIQVIIEPADCILPALAFAGLLVGEIDVIHISYSIEKITMALHVVFEKSNFLFRYWLPLSSVMCFAFSETGLANPARS